MKRAWIGLGGNVGDVRGAMRTALATLERGGDAVRRVSALYETPPWGPVKQDRFLNACAEIATERAPAPFLRRLHEIEREARRERLVRWGPRTLDLDLLAYEGFESDDPALAVPHPRMADRAFVTVPLAEIAPDLVVHGEAVSALAARADTGGMVRLEDAWFVPDGPDQPRDF